MTSDIDKKQLYRQISQDIRNIHTPPRFIYAREPGSRAPWRFRIPLGNKKYERRLLQSLSSRGLVLRIWTPVPKPQSASSVWLDVFDVFMDAVCFVLSGCRPN